MYEYDWEKDKINVTFWLEYMLTVTWHNSMQKVQSITPPIFRQYF